MDVQPHEEGAILSVRAQPGSRCNELRGEKDGALKVCVTQAPEKGKANKAIEEFLAKKLRLKKSQVEILSGQTTNQKKVLFRNVAAEALRSMIDAACVEDAPKRKRER